MIRQELLNKVLEVKPLVVDAKAIEIINELESIMKQELEDQSGEPVIDKPNDALDAIMYGWEHFIGWCEETGAKPSDGKALSAYCEGLRG